MGKLFCVAASAAIIAAAAAPGAVWAQGALDGTYAGVSATLTGSMSGRASCPQSFVPAPLVIAGGQARTRWAREPAEGTVTPQGTIVMRTAMAGRFDAQIDAQGGVRGTYNGSCMYAVNWRKR